MSQTVIQLPFTLNNSTLPVDQSTALDRLIGSIPGLIAWVKPGAGYFDSSGNVVEAWNNKKLVPQSPSGRWVIDTSANGKTVFRGVSTGTHYVPEATTQDLNVNSFTVAAILNIGSGDSQSDEFLAGLDAGQSGVLVPRIGFNGTRELRFYEGTTTIRAAYTGSSTAYVGNEALIMVCFDINEGITMFINGAQVVSNTTDKRPLTSGKWKIGSQTVTPLVTSTFTGKIGDYLLFNQSLASTRASGYRQAVNGLMGFYGITPAV